MKRLFCGVVSLSTKGQYASQSSSDVGRGRKSLRDMRELYDDNQV